MGITNNIPPSRLIQPGVIDNAAARPASPYEGQVIFQKDTDQLLVWNGTAWVIPNSPAQNPQGLELISSTTIGTTVSSVPVTGAFSTTYDNYRIVVSGGVGSLINPTLNIVFGSTVTGYEWAYGAFSNTLTAAGVGSTAGTFIPVGQSNTNFTVTAFDVFSPFLAKYTAVFGGNSYDLNNQQARGPYNGVLKNTTSYTDFTISPASGTLTGGTISLYGYRK
jgi:hypothetical protein